MSITEKFLTEIRVIEEKSGISRVIIVSLYFLAFVLVASGLAVEQVMALVSFGLPTIFCLKTLNLDNKDEKQWLSYWGILSIITLVEATIDSVLSFIFYSGFSLNKIQLYQLFKFALLVFSTLPSINSSYYIYNKLLSKHFQVKETKDLMYRKILSMRPSTAY